MDQLTRAPGLLASVLPPLHKRAKLVAAGTREEPLGAVFECALALPDDQGSEGRMRGAGGAPRKPA